MSYLEYEKGTKQVIEIHTTQPDVIGNYDFALSNQFQVGDEFAYTIFINEVDENKTVKSFYAIKNNPQAQRMLADNAQLSGENADLLFKNAMQDVAITTLQDENAELLLKIAMLEANANV